MQTHTSNLRTKIYITFSQCVHCSSKLRLEAAALAFVLAFFPPMTQLFIKLFSTSSSSILIRARIPPQQLWPMTKMFSTRREFTANSSAAFVSEGPLSKVGTKLAILRIMNASPG
ncbi:hypothetical protein V8G54_033903 [Vigna mungo]|uniref:Uncharacterized protein n=1 Tax=Vigna mungo TaxID=3915 RepID=A0AAQ3MPU7_VIGMU